MPFWTKEQLCKAVTKNLHGSKLIVVSNREPYIHVNTEQGIHCKRPASGMAARARSDPADIRRGLDRPWKRGCRHQPLTGTIVLLFRPKASIHTPPCMAAQKIRGGVLSRPLE